MSTLDYMFNDTQHPRNHCADVLQMNRQTFSTRCKEAYGVEAYEARFPRRPQVTAETKLKMIELILKTDLSFADIGRMFDVSHTPVSKIARTVMTFAQLDAREINSRKAGGHKANGTNDATYLLCQAPDWYTGYINRCGQTRVHIINWCEANGETALPEGYVVHHIDHDHRNNEPSNLQLMTRGEHTSHHHNRS